MATKDEIINRAANGLGVLRLSGQNLQDQDKVRIEAGYLEVYEGLKAEGDASWAYAGSVPDKLTPFVVMLVVQNCVDAGGFGGVSPERYQRIQLAAGPNGEKAKGKIKELKVTRYASQSEPQDF